MQARLIVALCLLSSAPAWGAEPSGCDKFKWPVDKERAALTSQDRPNTASGLELAIPAKAVLELKTPADAKLPRPPERKPKDGTFAGFLKFKGPPKAGAYTISLSSNGWIDVIQDGEQLKPMDHSGVTDCAGIRKVVKFDLSGGPFAVQISGATENSISLAVLPAD
ncbi:hypothetical protein RPMA_04450 [Tardiphaga alba]|uniref:PA14 domain-containing protein n=1 Tax=Tardiphaga alba TaxID=340268 RepID=A0ABX8A4N5_9BRAD|nr:hypothetical protein [Tardiphaga alba]QUS38182.1 hypothetical protein RPMA_04450 [Tardiphaga alba]